MTLKAWMMAVGAVLYAGLAFAQEAAVSAEPSWKPLLDMAIKSLVPALWMAVGPVAVAAITKQVNKYTMAYVPRELQVVLSGLIGAVGAGLTGSPEMAVTGMVGGASAQVYAATPPAKLLTEGPAN